VPFASRADAGVYRRSSLEAPPTYAGEAMSTFLFVSIPVPAHTANPLPFAARLVERGHRVLWYAGAVFHPQIRAIGAEPLPYVRAEDFGGVAFDEHWSELAPKRGVATVRATFAQVFVGQSLDRCADLLDILRDHHVDAMLADGIVFAARLASEVTGVPWATFGDGPLPHFEADTPPFGPGLPYASGLHGRFRNRVVTAAAARVVFGPAQKRYDAIRRELGLPVGLGVQDAMVSPMLHLQGCTAGFEYPRVAVPGHMHYVGALRPDPPVGWVPPSWWPEVVGASGTVVVVSQGTLRGDVTELLVPTVQGLAGAAGLVVVTTGSAPVQRLVDELGGRLPENVRAVPSVPYDLLFAHTDVFVTNGGYTGVTLALAHGVPLVQAGTTEEKSEIGARIAHTGVGLSLRTTRPSADVVATAVRRVLTEPAFGAATRRVQAEMADHDAGREGADLLEELARTGQPVLRRPVPAAG